MIGKIKSAISNYKMLLKDSLLREIIGGCVFAILFVLTLHFEKGLGVKNLVVCLVISFLSGLFIAVPKPKLPAFIDVMGCVAVFAAYLFFVPKRMYIRTSLVTSDLSDMVAGIGKLNIFIIIMLFFALLIILQRTSLALGFSGIVLLFLTIVNYYVSLYRGDGLSLFDFRDTGTALTIMGGYSYEVSSEMWKTFLYYLFFIVLGFRIDVRIKGWKYHIVITLVAILGLLGTYHLYKADPIWENDQVKGESGNILGGEHAYGLFYYLWMSTNAANMERPQGYSNSELSRIMEMSNAEYKCLDKETSINTKPNIILIMNEAWSDLSVLGKLETNEDYFPFYNSLEGNVIKGNTYVNVLGGMTADSEFEALTGGNLAFLDIAAVPYRMQVNHAMPSLATVLSEQGYETYAMHPNVGASWKRSEVYKYLGFDRFITIDDYSVEYEYIGSLISDKCNYDELIYDYEHRDTSKPFFMFNITIQNHANYGNQTEEVIKTVKIGNTECDDMSDVNVYLSLMKLSDDALKGLIEYFEAVDEPTIICMFGDHQPKLTDRFYDYILGDGEFPEADKEFKMHTTPYLIWANYDLPKLEYGDISSSHIGPILCELAGLELSPYYKFILNTREEIPAFSRFNLVDYEESMAIRDYRMLQYNSLMEENYRRDIFSVY